MTASKMTVLVISSSAGKNLGGLATLTHSVVELFPQCGVAYGLISELKHGRQNDELSILRPPNSIRNILSNIVEVRRQAKRYDIIHAFDGWPYGLYGYFAVLGTAKKLFISGIGTYSVAPLNNRLPGFLLKRAYRRANKIFCISRYTQAKILDKVRLTNTVVIPLGFKPLPALTAGQIAGYKAEYGLGERYPILLTVGDIKARKGQLDTLRALAELKNRYPDFLYIMVGAASSAGYVGEIRDYAQRHNLSANILFPADVTSDEKLAFFYTVSDIFLLNSNNYKDSFEGFGLVLLEAAQFGKPLIGSKNCGIEDALRDGYNGFLAEQGNAQDIAAKISLILDKHYRVFAANSREYCSHFSWLKTVQEYCKYYGQD